MRPIIAANWKMNTTLSEAMVLAGGVKEGVAHLQGIDVVLCPPFPWLATVAEELKFHPLKHLYMGAQNIFWKDSGAYTGEVSATMIKDIVQFVIIGHSERRAVFHETDQEIAAKVKAALTAGLRPILCIGELRRPSEEKLQRPIDLHESDVRQPLAELKVVLDMLDASQRRQLIVAYEPVWAISSNANAVPATGVYANAVTGLIKKMLPSDCPVLYGGSAKPENAKEFLSQPHIDGLLVGGASLKIDSFVKICSEAA